ncbi:MAG: hypothetical protein Q8880_04235 [Bacteroidota bacterium]|nr:hypothetical protein [Bacteroidota bacterium]
MNFQILFDYPAWFISFCLICGGIYSSILYYKDKSFLHTNIWYRRGMAMFRFIAISLIALLLMNPLVKTLENHIEKPIIIVAQDNSESIRLTKDSTFYKNEYKKNLDNLVDKLSGKYDVKSYSFGEKVVNDLDYKYSNKQTDFSGFLDDISERYINRNVGAVIIASDGLYNKGKDPVYSADNIKAPIYTIALGDTTVRKDLCIKKVNYNRKVFLGNTFPVEVLIKADKSKGAKTELAVFENNNKISEKQININSENFTGTVIFQIEAKQKGNHTYKIKLNPLSGEVSLLNNNYDIYVDVLDAKEKILILANSPHPDVSAIKQSLENTQGYEVETGFIYDFNKDINNYNIVVLHQLPSINNLASNLLGKLKSSGIPVLYILGAQTNFNALNAMNFGLIVNSANGSMNESQAVVNQSFSLFSLNDNIRSSLNKYPPLECPFGTFKVGNPSGVLIYQKIGVVKTENPLISFYDNGLIKAGFIAGEGIWKWRLANYASQNNFDNFNDLIGKIIQYLSAKNDKSKFRVIVNNNINENEPVEFNAELYNDSYELVNNPDVNLELINKDNKKFNYIFSRNSNAYYLNAGLLPVGNYKYKARTKLGEKVYEKEGSVNIISLQVEATNTIADHQLMYRLANKHGGKMVYPNNLNSLFNMLEKREDIKSVTYSNERFNEFINLKWLFFIIIAFISTEWFFRKRNGGY